MKKYKSLVIANWKMYRGPYQTGAFIKKYGQELSTLCSKKNINFVFCPSFDALEIVKKESHAFNFFIGAQDCSAFTNGPYTGQVAASSLKELGCEYCIVGHSETKQYHKQTDNTIVKKVLQLVSVGLTPIICVGETETEHKNNKIEGVIASQLLPIFQALNTKDTTIPLCIAYEPLWAIASGKTADATTIKSVFEFIRSLVKDSGVQNDCTLLYGGSVNATTMTHLGSIKGCDGFLVGSASTDFQELKKIVDLL